MQALLQHEACERIDVASRGNAANDAFFYGFENTQLQVHRLQRSAIFQFQEMGTQFLTNTMLVDPMDYDVVMMRLPRPIPDGFFEFLETIFANKMIINRPRGILMTSSKAFLLNFPSVCPPMQLVRTVEELDVFKSEYDFVLKPFENYGGKGIIKIEGDQVQEAGKTISYTDFKAAYAHQRTPYLAMQFLKNVSQGDKRIVVVNGEVIGSVLRLPAKGNWLCNVSQGGKAVETRLTPEEHKIAEIISPVLHQHGIIAYGFDTLVDDSGKRVLSEINTLSIGGLIDITSDRYDNVIGAVAENIWKHMLEG